MMISMMRRSAAQARYLLGGAFALLFVFQVVIVGQAGEIQRTQTFGRMADLLPGFLQRGLGSNALLLATFRGLVAFGYFHPVVCLLVSIVAMYVATEPAHEIESGLVDLELARAVPRHRLLTRSALLAGLAIAAALSVMFAGTTAGGWVFDATGYGLPDMAVRVRLLLHLAGVAACFGGYALFVGTLARRWTTAFTTSVLTAVVLYLLDFLSIGWQPIRQIGWISPFRYTPWLAIIAGTASHWRNLVILFAAAAVFTALAYRQFERRDL
jgi:ABC-type transport system involved in multi-copper enzyme maturation permease subunit